jgi:hypothetical protein
MGGMGSGRDGDVRTRGLYPTARARRNVTGRRSRVAPVARAAALGDPVIRRIGGLVHHRRVTVSQDIFPETRARLGEWQARPEVLGVLLVGSKSRGHGDPLSDDDLEVLLTGEAFTRLGPEECGDAKIVGEGDERRIIYDAQYLPLGDLERKAGSTFDLDHWPYERARVLFDRDGRTQRAVTAAGAMSEEFRAARLRHGALDGWIAFQRAKKTVKRTGAGPVRLLVDRGVRALSRVLFALEGRWVPLDHWYEAELRTLRDPAGVGPRLLETLATARPEALGQALDSLAAPLAREGVLMDPASRHALFFRLIHPSAAEERGRHATP